MAAMRAGDALPPREGVAAARASLRASPARTWSSAVLGTDPASPILLHGEGLETTLSPWSVSGHEGRVYFGGLADKAQPERGRVNVMLVDDDGSDAADRIGAKVEQWTAAGYCVLVAPAFDDIEGGGRDWNDLLQDDGTDAVRDRLAALIPPIEPTETPRPTATMTEARAETDAAIEAYFAGRGPSTRC